MNSVKTDQTFSVNFLFRFSILDSIFSKWKGKAGASSVDPDQTPRFVASDLGPCCLLRPVSPKAESKYSNNCQMNYHIYNNNSNTLMAPYSSKIDIFIQEKLKKLIYDINTIIECGI